MDDQFPLFPAQPRGWEAVVHPVFGWRRASNDQRLSCSQTALAHSFDWGNSFLLTPFLSVSVVSSGMKVRRDPRDSLHIFPKS